MFTGLIEQVGRLAGLDHRAGGAVIHIEHEAWPDALTLGESVAVNGACLTVTAWRPGSFSCDVLSETLDRCTLRERRSGDLLNLERALRAGDRFGGHMVTGHVDGTGRVREVRRAGADWVLRIACDEALLSGVVMKGSIACDGVSLTVSAVWPDAFEVHIIPHTWRRTNLHVLEPGAALNLETDLLGKYVDRWLSARRGETGGVTEETLRRAGFRCG